MYCASSTRRPETSSGPLTFRSKQKPTVWVPHRRSDVALGRVPPEQEVGAGPRGRCWAVTNTLLLALLGMPLLVGPLALRITGSLRTLGGLPTLVSPDQRVMRLMSRAYVYYLGVLLGFVGAAMVAGSFSWLVSIVALAWLGVEVFVRTRPRERWVRIPADVVVMVRPATPLAPWYP